VNVSIFGVIIVIILAIITIIQSRVGSVDSFPLNLSTIKTSSFYTERYSGIKPQEYDLGLLQK